MDKTFKKDLYRYYGTNKEGLKKRIFRPLEIKYIYICIRIEVHHCNRKFNVFTVKFVNCFYEKLK